jgi:hypothetical protein
VTHPAVVGGAWPAITRRAAASSVAPGLISPGAPVSAEGASAIASLGAREPGIHRNDREDH